jgi:hypothetical protein
MPIGSTSEETEIALGLKHQTVSARYTELREWGYIEYWCDGGNIPIERDTVSGRGACVHITTKMGKDAVELGFPIYKPGSRDPTEGKHGGNPTSAAAYDSIVFAAPTLRLMVLKHIHSMTPRIG